MNVQRREQFVVDTSAISSDRRVDVCRFAMGLVAEAADKFETDLPLGNADRWPAAVARAAERLSRFASGRRDESGAYKRTGRVSADDQDDWDAIVCFAPYAYDASVWGDAGDLVQVADEGSSLVVRLRPDDRDLLEQFEPSIGVVPVKRWKKQGGQQSDVLFNASNVGRSKWQSNVRRATVVGLALVFAYVFYSQIWVTMSSVLGDPEDRGFSPTFQAISAVWLLVALLPLGLGYRRARRSETPRWGSRLLAAIGISLLFQIILAPAFIFG